MTRDEKEMASLFSDPKFARQAWKAVGQAIANSPCSKPMEQTDKDGNVTFASAIDCYSYEKLKEDLKKLGEKHREPTELEMIMQCQMIRARYDTAAAVFVRDTLGAKPIDESKMEAQISNPYESLSDEELEAIAKMREQKALQEPTGR